MLKRLAILGLLGFCLHGAWSQVSRDRSQQKRPTQNEQNNTKPIQPSPSAIQIHDGSAKQEQTGDPKSSGYPWKELLAPANIPNWLLTIIAGVTGLFVYRTLKAIKRQADIMETQATDTRVSGASASLVAQGTLDALTKQAAVMEFQAGQMVNQTLSIQSSVTAAQASADAALKTVQVMIDSERPWVIAHMEQSKRSCLLDNGNVRFTWTVKNIGKSPAKLIEAGAMVSLDTIGPSINQIQYKMEPLDERILVPGDSAPLFVFWSIIENGRTRTRLGKTLDEFNDLAIVYGRIRYRSAINTPDIYETRFSETSPISGGICDGFKPSWPTVPEDIGCT